MSRLDMSQPAVVRLLENLRILLLLSLFSILCTSLSDALAGGSWIQWGSFGLWVLTALAIWFEVLPKVKKAIEYLKQERSVEEVRDAQ